MTQPVGGVPGVSKMYSYEYGVQLTRLDYTNPISIFAYFKNVSKKSVDWVLDRTIFYKEEKAKRQADADKRHQEVIEKKLKNLEMAHNLRRKMIKDGTKPDEANAMIASLLVDQKATLLVPTQKGATA